MPYGRRTLVAALAVLSGAACLAASSPADAQAIVTAVNGDPITTFDIDQYMKILRLEKKPSARADALEAVVSDRIKYDEARHWGVDGTDTDVSSALARVAAAAKMDSQSMSEAAVKDKIDLDSIRNHLRALAAWDNLVRARNKGVGATDEEINAEIAAGHAETVTNYRLQQVIFVLPVNASPATVEGRIGEAKALRNRFDGCDTGLQLARALPDVAIKESTNRASDALSAGLRKLLAATPRGMLTTPQRGTSGIEMVAVCEKNDASDLTTQHDRIQKEIITNKLAAVSAQMYKDLRRTAVISKN